MDSAATNAPDYAWSEPVRRRVALVFTDIVGSTRLLAQLGDLAGNRRILDHHRLAARVLESTGGGEIINTGGDLIFLAFPEPRKALRFALALQRALQSWLPEEPARLRVRDRIGIHFAEVEETRRTDGGKDLTGFEVTVAQRIMTLAAADQVLLTEAAFDAARAARDQGELAEFAGLRWLSHGRHDLRSVEGPVPVFEVGEEGIAPLQAPEATAADQAREDELTGWRPASGFGVPGTPWIVERFLGNDRFGEVWLARQAPGAEPRVLRFCFGPLRLRALREAVSLFERLRQSIADHAGVARLHGFQIDRAPHYLESEFVVGAPLPDLCHAREDAEVREEGVRLEIIAQAAEALEAAHRAGVVHGDLRPAAVLVSLSGREGTPPRVKIIDFGVGWLVARELGAKFAQNRAALAALPDRSSFAGAPLYWAPELFKGEAPSPASDVYALGVLLYQVLVCDLQQPVTIDVARRIGDPLLLEDLLACLATRPEDRLASAGELATRLRSLPQRRTAAARRGRRAYWEGVMLTGALAAVLLVLLGSLTFEALRKERAARFAREDAVRAREVAERNAMRLSVAGGVRRMEEGDLSGALEQFADALRYSPEGTPGYIVQQRRFASVVRAVPRQVQEWHVDVPLASLALDPRGDRIAGGTSIGEVFLWSSADDRRLGPVRRIEGPVDTLGFAPEGAELFAHTYGGPLVAWALAPGGDDSAAPRILHPAARLAAASPDGRWFAIAGLGPGLWLLPWAGGPPVALSVDESVDRLVFSTDGLWLAAAVSNADNGTMLAVWNTATRHRTTVARAPGTEVVFLSIDASDRFLGVALRERRRVAGGPPTTAHKVALYSLPDLLPLPPERYHNDSILWAGFAPRGTLFLSTSAGSGSRARVIDALGTAGLPVELPHPHSVVGGDLSPDGRYALTACFDRLVRLWDPARVQLVGEPLRHPAWQDSGNFKIRSMLDGRRVVTAVDNAVRVFDFASHASIIPPLELEVPLDVVELSADGRRLAGANSAKGVAAVWDTATGQRLTPRLRHPGPLGLLTFDRTATRLFAADASLTNRARNGVWVTELARKDSAPRRLAETGARPVRLFAGPDNALNVITEDATWFFWKSGTPTNPPATRRLGTRVDAAFLSADGTLMATLAHLYPTNVDVSAFSAQDLKDAAALAAKLRRPSDALSTYLAGRLDAALRVGLATWPESGAVPMDHRAALAEGLNEIVRGPSIWDPARFAHVNLRSEARFRLSRNPQDAELARLNLILLQDAYPDEIEQTGAMGAERTDVVVWRTATGERLGRTISTPYPVRRAAFNHDDTRVITACTDATFEPRAALSWDVATGTPVGSELPHEDGVLTVACHPDDDHVVTGGEDGLVRFWDPLNPGRRLAEQRMGYQVLEATYDQKGDLVAAISADGTARVWDSATGEPVTPTLRHPARVRWVGFTEGAWQLITRCEDGRVYVWDLSPFPGDPARAAALANIIKRDGEPGRAAIGANWQEIRSGWGDVLAVAPAAAAAWHRLESERCQQAGEADLALAQIELSLRILPGHWPLHWQRALLLERLGRPGVDAALRDVVRLDPDCNAAQDWLARLPAPAQPEVATATRSP